MAISFALATALFEYALLPCCLHVRHILLISRFPEWFVKLMLLQNILCIFTYRDILPSSFPSFVSLFLQNQKSWTTFLTSCLDMPSQACLLLLINWTSSSHVNIAESKCFLKIPSHLSSKRVLIVLTSGISFLL